MPEVCWKLWPRTFQLLKKFRSNDPEHVLLNENGTPLRVFDGGRNVDNVRSAYERLCWKVGYKGRSLKHLRKTAATKLASRPSYRPYCQHFLCQSPQNTADAAYVNPSQKIFDQAVMWLGRQFKVVS